MKYSNYIKIKNKDINGLRHSQLLFEGRFLGDKEFEFNEFDFNQEVNNFIESEGIEKLGDLLDSDLFFSNNKASSFRRKKVQNI